MIEYKIQGPPDKELLDKSNELINDIEDDKWSVPKDDF